MAIRENLVLDQGADGAIELHLTEKDGTKKNLTGYNASGSIKEAYSSADSDAINFTTVIAAPATDGVLTLLLTNQQTSSLNPRLSYVYDVVLTYQDSDSNTIVERILEGNIGVNPSVTRVD
jgi:hypothetical protein